MSIDRRNFILNAALFASTPAIASFLSLSSTQQSRPTLPLGPLSTQLAGGGTDMNCVVFKIYGWDRCDDIAVGGSKISPADPATNDLKADQVWISVNQSWRTAWR